MKPTKYSARPRTDNFVPVVREPLIGEAFPGDVRKRARQQRIELQRENDLNQRTKTHYRKGEDMAADLSYLDYKNFAIELTDQCNTDERWLSVMKFGMTELLKKPKVLMECIVRRAKRMELERIAQRANKMEIEYACADDFAVELIEKLGLRFELCEKAEE